MSNTSTQPPADLSPYQPPIEVAKRDSNDNVVGIEFVVEPLVRRGLWFRILGVLMILCGTLCSITVIGALFGVPMIVSGVLLYQVAGCYSSGFENRDAGELTRGANKLCLAALMAVIAVGLVCLLLIMYIGLIIFAITWPLMAR